MVICLVIDCYVSSYDDRQKISFCADAEKKRWKCEEDKRKRINIGNAGKNAFKFSDNELLCNSNKSCTWYFEWTEVNVAEQHLFQRLHIMLTGMKLSEKCYKLVESRASNKVKSL